LRSVSGGSPEEDKEGVEVDDCIGDYVGCCDGGVPDKSFEGVDIGGGSLGEGDGYDSKCDSDRKQEADSAAKKGTCEDGDRGEL